MRETLAVLESFFSEMATEAAADLALLVAAAIISVTTIAQRLSTLAILVLAVIMNAWSDGGTFAAGCKTVYCCDHKEEGMLQCNLLLVYHQKSINVTVYL